MPLRKLYLVGQFTSFQNMLAQDRLRDSRVLISLSAYLGGPLRLCVSTGLALFLPRSRRGPLRYAEMVDSDTTRATAVRVISELLGRPISASAKLMHSIAPCDESASV